MRIIMMIMVTLAGSISAQAESVLLVADEWPAMEILEQHLTANGFTVDKCEQQEMPEDLSGYHAIFHYVHGRFHDEPAQAMMAYANNGGHLILLHHGINSGQVRTKGWVIYFQPGHTPEEFENAAYQQILLNALTWNQE